MCFRGLRVTVGLGEEERGGVEIGGGGSWLGGGREEEVSWVE